MRSAFAVLVVSLVLAEAGGAAAGVPAPEQFRQRYPGAAVHFRAGTAIPSLITDLRAALPSADPAKGSVLLVHEWAELFGFDPTYSSLSLDRVGGGDKVTAYRLAQYHQGLRVLYADIVVTTDRLNRVTVVSNSLERLGWLPFTFALSQADAVQAAVAHLQPQAWSGKIRHVEQVIAQVDGQWRAVWMVEVPAARPVGLWRVMVDSESPTVLGMTNLMKRAQGYAYDIAPELGAYQTVTLNHLPNGSTVLNGTYVDVYTDCDPFGQYGSYCSNSNRQAKATNGDFLYVPKEGNTIDPFAEVHTYYQIDRMRDFYVANGFTGLDTKVTVAVNFTDDPDMACNGGSAMDMILIGLCRAYARPVNYAYDSQILMHEYTHTMVDHAVELPYYGVTDEWGLVAMPAGLNEGYADFFPAVELDYHLVGHHVATTTGDGEAMRNLDDVRLCPEHLDNESHEDGRIWGAVNWAAYKASNKDPNLPRAVLESISTLSQRATFQDAANAALAAASNYGQSVRDALEGAYRARGLLGCGREIEIQNGVTLTATLMHPYFIRLQGTTSPNGAQYKINVPPGATSLNFTMSAVDYHGDGHNTLNMLNVYVGQNSHVRYNGANTTAFRNSNGKGTLAISNPASGWYYILPVGKNFDYDTYSVRFTMKVEYTGGSFPDAGAGDAGGGMDASTASDSGTSVDASVVRDAAVVVDAAQQPDAAEVRDASVVVDAAQIPDAATQPDAAVVVVDSGVVDAASPLVDAAQPVDAATSQEDASVVLDAAAVSSDAAVAVDAAVAQLDSGAVNPTDDAGAISCACDVSSSCDGDCGCDPQCEETTETEDEKSCACHAATGDAQDGLVMFLLVALASMRLRSPRAMRR